MSDFDTEKVKKAYHQTITQSGETQDGKIVLAGMGVMCFTHGIPLDIALMFFKEKDFVVDWVDYVQSSLLDGHNPRTIKARISSATTDVYGKIDSHEIMSRIERVLDYFSS